jgi:D-alanine-D-alanine ligase
MKVTVLYGGPSAERDVSLVSGKAVANGLRQAGHEVFEFDIRPEDLSGLDRPCDVVFPVLHGAWGESGELQEILEQRGLRFVGSGSAASRLGMDKIQAKRAWEQAGLPTPPYVEVTRPEGWEQVGLPCVVKAPDSGSSIGVYICRDAAAAQKAAATVLSDHAAALVAST